MQKKEQKSVRMLLVQVFCVAMLRVAITIECFGFLRVKVDLQMHLVAFPDYTLHIWYIFMAQVSRVGRRVIVPMTENRIAFG